MRVFVLAVVCSGALLGGAAFADPAQTSVSPPASAPSASTQPVAPAATPAVAAPSQSTTAARAQTGPESVVVNGARDQVNLDEVVCKSEAPATGTRLGGGRECHTVREWNQRERQAQDLTREQERTGMALSR